MVFPSAVCAGAAAGAATAATIHLLSAHAAAESHRRRSQIGLHQDAGPEALATNAPDDDLAAPAAQPGGEHGQDEACAPDR